MPYIKTDRRLELETDVDPITAGELNYVITQLCIKFWLKQPSYTTWALLSGTLQDVRSEFYTRIMSIYESRKRWETGDVYAPAIKHLYPEVGRNAPPKD